MNYCISVNSIFLGKLLKRYEFISKGKEANIKEPLRRPSIWRGCIDLQEKLSFNN